MMSYEQIVSEAARAARAAKRHGKRPVFLSALSADGIRNAEPVPFLGDYVPRGFKRLHVRDTFGERYGHGTADGEALLVDSSGFGSRGELALTVQEFAEFTQLHPGYAYGILEAGQFQVVIGVFKHSGKEVA